MSQVSIILSMDKIGGPTAVTVSLKSSDPHTLVAVRSILYIPGKLNEYSVFKESGIE